MINTGFMFSLIAALVTLGGLCVAFGVLKAKIAENGKVNDAQQASLGGCVTRQEMVEAGTLYVEKSLSVPEIALKLGVN